MSVGVCVFVYVCVCLCVCGESDDLIVEKYVDVTDFDLSALLKYR